MHNNQSIVDGYARVSTDGQGVAAQVNQLKAAGCGKVLREVANGARSDRKVPRESGTA